MGRNKSGKYIRNNGGVISTSQLVRAGGGQSSSAVGSSGKVRVYSILDKIRLANKCDGSRYQNAGSHQLVAQNNSALVETVSIMDDSWYG